MKEQTIEEICDMLEYIAENNTVPRNIREVASNSSELLQNDEMEDSIKINTAIGNLDNISNDPNIPLHARTMVWEILSKLESI